MIRRPRPAGRTHGRWHWSPTFLLTVAIALVALLASACGSSSNSSSPGNSGATPSSSASSGGVAGVGDPASIVAAGYKGTWTAPPTSGPKAQAGKSIWIISCGESIPSCSVPVAAMKAAAEAIGWKVHVFDSKLVPTNAANGITQAIAAKPDAIITVAFGCDVLGAPLRQAKQAGIKLAGFAAFDCDDSALKSGDPVFSTFAAFGDYTSQAAEQEAWGALRAAWIIQKTGGKAKVVLTNLTGSVLVAHQRAGFVAEMKKCSACQIVDQVDISIGDLQGPVAAQKLETALQKHPEATALAMFNDSSFAQFGNKVLNSLGRNDLAVMGGECFAANTDQIRSGGPQDACAGLPQTWISWALIDELNRQFADPGSAPVDEGIGYQLVDADHNLPTSGQWTTGVDFEAAYRKVWGVG